MSRLPLAVLALCLLATRASAVTYDGVQPTGHQVLTPSSATSLTPPTGSTVAVIQCLGANIRYYDDGTVPTSSTGIELVIGEKYFLKGNLASVQIIQETSTATCTVLYYQW